MTELQIGQSLTYEQVMALPDGAQIKGVFFACPPDTLIRIGGLWHYASGGGCGITDKENWGSGMWVSATLVSLPSQAEPCVPSKPQEFSFGGMKMKIDPSLGEREFRFQSESDQVTVTNVGPDPAPVAEIEKEAALALLAGKLQELQALGARDYVCRVVDNYRAAVAYAKSKGAL